MIELTSKNLITYLQVNKIELDDDIIKKIKIYYSKSSNSSYSQDNAEFYYQCLQHHFNLAEIRVADETLISSFNANLYNTKKQKYIDTIISIVISDIPFMLQSIRIRFNQLGEIVNRVHSMSLVVKRSVDSKTVEIDEYSNGELEDGAKFESFLQFQLEQIPDSKIDYVKLCIVETIEIVKNIVADWQPCVNKLSQIIDLVKQKPQQKYLEISNFLNWIKNDNFAIFGIVDLDANCEFKKDTGLGLFSKKVSNIININEYFPKVTSNNLRAISISKMTKSFYLHRTEHMDNIIIKFDDYIFCFTGFFSSSSFSHSIFNIPYLQNKADYLLKKSRYRKGQHANKTLLKILENLPKEWLFQTKRSLIYKIANKILSHNELQQINVYISQDVCSCFYTIFVYMPKSVFNSILRNKIQRYLSDKLAASESFFQIYYSNSTLTRIEFTIYSEKQDINYAKLIQDIKELAIDWNLELYKEFKLHYSIDTARKLIQKYQDSFSIAYKDNNSIKNAVVDIINIESVSKKGIKTSLAKTLKNKIWQLSLKLYVKGMDIKLSDILPILDNMGFYVISEEPFKVTNTSINQQIAVIRSFNISRKDGVEFNFIDKEIFLTGFKAILNKTIENDNFNSLIIKSKLNVYQVNVLRSIFRYLKQIRFLYSYKFTVSIFSKNYKVTQLLFKLFDAKFNPNIALNENYITIIKKQIITYLDAINSRNDDTVIRSYLAVIGDAILRTNFYQDNKAQYLTYKIQSGNIAFMPKPCPKYEIFVYSMRFEGIHLRLGNIARGGLRWSDRVEDYRTEILGLVKAQQVKNTIIVPVGSKGGFVLKNTMLSKKQILIEGIDCYQQFIQALIDITDNIVDYKIVKPKKVNVIDGDDPYLVVAADKGTATFSDIANAVSEKNNFWLGDAFASGGSIGYDHKKIGITARGVWESVKRNFKELDKDIQNEDFTIAAIGDMSGDVFGNGMLLSKHIKLVLAFNHQHIFIDPNPDIVVSFNERQRLFNMAGSTWLDYTESLISIGGGVYERSAKLIILSNEAQNLLKVRKKEYPPDELIRLILKAEVELLWNGGIGTYVIASNQNNADAQDKTNDNLRVFASDLRCKVIGEGGNLGLTQLARIEYCSLGGKCYTDAIDNSAGVDCSDHEVNLKILLNIIVNSGEISFVKRNKMLELMEVEITQLCLLNNYQQTQAISIYSQANSNRLTDQITAFDCLEGSGLLDRDNEFVAASATLKEKLTTSKCLTKPELAVLLAYSKMYLYQKLLPTNICDDKFLQKSLFSYFPSLIQQKYAKFISKHRLKNEIILTVIVNDLANKLGPSFPINAHFLTYCSYVDIAKAYLITNQLLGIDKLFNKIKNLDNKISIYTQYTMFSMLVDTQISNIYYLLLNHTNIDISSFLEQNQNSYQMLLINMKNYLSDITKIKQDKLLAVNVPKDIALEVASVSNLYNVLDIINIINKTAVNYDRAATYYLKISKLLNIRWLITNIKLLSYKSTLHLKAEFNLLQQLRTIHNEITCLALKLDNFAEFEKTKSQEIIRINATIDELKESYNVDFATFSVLVNDLGKLTPRY